MTGRRREWTVGPVGMRDRGRGKAMPTAGQHGTREHGAQARVVASRPAVRESPADLGRHRGTRWMPWTQSGRLV